MSASVLFGFMTLGISAQMMVSAVDNPGEGVVNMNSQLVGEDRNKNSVKDRDFVYISGNEASDTESKEGLGDNKKIGLRTAGGLVGALTLGGSAYTVKKIFIDKKDSREDSPERQSQVIDEVEETEDQVNIDSIDIIDDVQEDIAVAQEKNKVILPVALTVNGIFWTVLYFIILKITNNNKAVINNKNNKAVDNNNNENNENFNLFILKILFKSIKKNNQ